MNCKLKLLVESAFMESEKLLVHCITSAVTSEILVNAILSVGGSAFLTEDSRSIEVAVKRSDALLLNFGQMSLAREQAIRLAHHYATNFQTPMVVDLVAISTNSINKALANDLVFAQGSLIKGNMSEMRAYAGLSNQGHGVDAGQADGELTSVNELSRHLKAMAQVSGLTYLATGSVDLIVTQDQSFLLKNGVTELVSFTGSGDIVGALAAYWMAKGFTSLDAAILAVSYFNLCGEKVYQEFTQPMGYAAFRYQVLNQLSLLKLDQNWYQAIRSELL